MLLNRYPVRYFDGVRNVNLLVDGVVMRDLDGSIHVNGMRDWNHSSYNFDDALGLPERRGGIEHSD